MLADVPGSAIVPGQGSAQRASQTDEAKAASTTQPIGHPQGFVAEQLAKTWLTVVGEQLTMTGETTPVVEPAVPPLEPSCEPPAHARFRPSPAKAKSHFIGWNLERAPLGVKSLSGRAVQSGSTRDCHRAPTVVQSSGMVGGRISSFWLCALLAGGPACLTVASPEAGGQGGSTTSPPLAILCNPACGANASCTPNGTCECYAGYTDCSASDGGTVCTQVLLDNDNCGGCGLICAAGESCLGGACTCDLTTCTNDGGEVCTDILSDPLNCEVCGHVCPTAESCVQGECVCMPSLTTAQCITDGGLMCVDLTMNPNGCGIIGCLCGLDGGTCCPGSLSCVDLASDPFNCGVCGNLCISGSCIPGDDGTGVCNCPLPYVWCGAICIDPYTDFNHCGGCTACAPPATQCLHGNCQ